MIDLLVISHACFTAINRNIYQLFQQDGWKVELVVPKSLSFPAGMKDAQPPMPGDPPIHYLPLIGSNPRIYHFEGLDELLSAKKPGIILLDNDPVSKMAIKVGAWCKHNEAGLFCISCENLPLDIMSTVRRRGIRSLPATLIKRGLLMRSKRLVDGVFTINNDGKQLFKREGFRNVERIPLGFDPKYFFVDEQKRNDIRRELQLNHTAIAYFGRLVPEKGVDLLINALEGLQQFPWKLMMDDFDEYASDYAQHVKKLLHESGIENRVVFISPSHFEIGGYMNAADIVVVPSIATAAWKEQYGRVAAEAMACGRTVIASDSGALPELLNNHGILFPEGNVDALKKILSNIISGTQAEAEYSENDIASYANESLSMGRQKTIMEAAFAGLKNTG